MKMNLKIGLIYAGSFLGAAALLVGATLGIASLKKTPLEGQGGYDTPGLPELTSQAIPEEDITDSMEGLNLLAEEQQDSILLEEAEIMENLSVSATEPNTELSYYTYRVQQGDMIGVLAEKFGITEDTLDSVNNITSARTLQIGRYLKVPTISGILYTVNSSNETPSTIAESYKVDAQRCASVNNLELDQVLPRGTTIFVPDAKMDYWTKLEINWDMFKKPLKASFRYSSYFGYRQNPFDATRRTYHNGVDMACPQGTNIYASQEGTVTTAGYSDVYGNYVIITHHSGYKTLYAHMTYYTVKKGQYVTPNTVIGKVGSTGQSTGPHLHFTIFKNDKAVNPENYW